MLEDEQKSDYIIRQVQLLVVDTDQRIYIEAMTGKKQIPPLPKIMRKTKKTPSLGVDAHIDFCNDLLDRAGASLMAQQNAALGIPSESHYTPRLSSKGDQNKSKGRRRKSEESGEESVTDAFEQKLEVARRELTSSSHLQDTNTKKRVKERRQRSQPEQLVVEFPTEDHRAAHRASRRKNRPEYSDPPSMVVSRKSRHSLKDDSERTADTEVSFNTAIEELNRKDSKDREKKKNKKKKKKQILGDFDDEFDWSESSIVWGDEELSSDEESPQPRQVCEGSSSAKDPSGMNFSTHKMFRRSTGGGGSVLSCGGRSRDPACSSSRSVMSSGSFRSERSNPLWQSFSVMNISRKQLEP